MTELLKKVNDITLAMAEPRVQAVPKLMEALKTQLWETLQAIEGLESK